MPGVIMTEPSGQNGTRTDHERDSIVNGINGAEDANVQNGGGSKDKARNVAASALSNDEGITKGHELVVHRPTEQNTNRMNDLPDHIPHITQGFVPLSLFLTRLAQATHNDLQDKVAELAKMPVPASLSNGNSSYSSSGPDDSSSENMRKKGVLANFAQEYHGKWMKALVITEWSRNSHLVSKLIDLKVHIDQQRMLYDNALDNIVNVKRDLAFARMPSPDLKTALQVLSTGSAPWMPDVSLLRVLTCMFTSPCIRLTFPSSPPSTAPIYRAAALDAGTTTQMDQRPRHATITTTKPGRF